MLTNVLQDTDVIYYSNWRKNCYFPYTFTTDKLIQMPLSNFH
jgi:hypothetical protein